MLVDSVGMSKLDTPVLWGAWVTASDDVVDQDLTADIVGPFCGVVIAEELLIYTPAEITAMKMIRLSGETTTFLVSLIVKGYIYPITYQELDMSCETMWTGK